jgi:hypothetical protein
LKNHSEKYAGISVLRLALIIIFTLFQMKELYYFIFPTVSIADRVSLF